MKIVLKSLVVSALILSASQSFAASVCKVYGTNGGYFADGNPRAFIVCNYKNPDSETIVYADGDFTDTRLMTLLAKLLDKGYKIVSQVSTSAGPNYTLVK